MTAGSRISIDPAKDSFSENGERFLTHFQPMFSGGIEVELG